MATAAGVAGGALLFEGIRNLMGSNPGPLDRRRRRRSLRRCCRRTPSRRSADNNPMPDDLRNEDHDTAAYDDGADGRVRATTGPELF